MEENREGAIKGEPSRGLQELLPDTPLATLLPLEKVHDEDFEEICRIIATQEMEIVRANLKGSRGVSQFGADVEGFSKDHVPILVISAKRYQKISAKKLEEWGTDFLECWKEHWEGKGVKRFVIAVTVQLNNDSLNAKVSSEVTRFMECGVNYDIWGLNELTERLSNNPKTISKYMHSGWVDIIANRLPSSKAQYAEQISVQKGPHNPDPRVSGEDLPSLVEYKDEVRDADHEPALAEERDNELTSHKQLPKGYLSEDEKRFREEAEQRQVDANPDLLAAWLEWRAEDLKGHATVLRNEAKLHSSESVDYDHYAGNLWDRIKKEQKSGSDDLARTLTEE